MHERTSSVKKLVLPPLWQYALLDLKSADTVAPIRGWLFFSPALLDLVQQRPLAPSVPAWNPSALRRFPCQTKRRLSGQIQIDCAVVRTGAARSGEAQLAAFLHACRVPFALNIVARVVTSCLERAGVSALAVTGRRLGCILRGVVGVHGTHKQHPKHCPWPASTCSPSHSHH